MAMLNINPDQTDDSGVLLAETSAGITTLTLNRPQVRNCLSEAMLDSVTEAIGHCAKAPECRVVILAANGPAFSSGHDMKQMTARRTDADRGRVYFEDIMARCSTMMQSIVRCPKPVIAQVQGVAAAAGCQLVASCDLAVASEAATFCTPGVHIGLFCSTPMVALSRNVSRKHAMEMLLVGDMVSAADALRMGLVNAVAVPEKLGEVTREMAATIASKSSHTLAVGKEAFYRQLEMPLGEAYDYASQVMVENMLARDAKEGIDAFIEKRSPDWQDR